MTKKNLSQEKTEELFEILKKRFEQNPQRHPSLQWSDVEQRLLKKTDKLWSLDQMNATEGEPDVVGIDKHTDEYIFIDCAAESPKARRSTCYDHQALESRKEHRPKNSAMGMAQEMGIELLNEQQYYDLQKVGKFDTKTSSWIKTPDSIRNLGGAIFGDFRFGRVFIYHNGAESYYGVRGFRGVLKF